MITPVSCHFCASRCGLLLNIENDRATKLTKAPCEENCPAGIDVPRYMRFIADDRFDEAIAVIREKAPFPGVLGCVCTHPCEADCRRGESDEPISIRALKYFVAKNERGAWKKDAKVAKPTGKKVAVIGSGPAGLTAAYYLAKQGHGVTVFEKLPVTGGMLRVGIPEYRLPREVLDKEIEDIKEVGVEIKTSSNVESLDSLFKQGYDALFVAVGAHRGTKLPLPGSDLGGILVGVSFLKEVNMGTSPKIGKKVVVLGGGNVAFDCARTALRLGATDVTMACVESRDCMLATPEEIEQGLSENISIHNSQTFTRITGNDGQVSGVECLEVRSFEFDNEGRLNVDAIAGSEHILPADTVIFAIGQMPEFEGIGGLDEIKASWRNTLAVDAITMATVKKGVYAGGDATTGPASVIEAIAAGRRAATSIDLYLGGSGDIDEVLAIPWVLLSPSGVGEVEGFKNRLPVKMLPVAERIKGFDQVELGFDKEKAIENAKRCLWCDMAEGNPEHPYSLGWSCKRGRAHTARYYQFSTPTSD